MPYSGGGLQIFLLEKTFEGKEDVDVVSGVVLIAAIKLDMAL